MLNSRTNLLADMKGGDCAYMSRRLVVALFDSQLFVVPGRSSLSNNVPVSSIEAPYLLRSPDKLHDRPSILIRTERIHWETGG